MAPRKPDETWAAEEKEELAKAAWDSSKVANVGPRTCSGGQPAIAEAGF